MATKQSTNYFDPKNNPFLDPKNNPFLDPEKNPLMKSDFGAFFGDYKAPQLNELAELNRKNFEAVAAANKTAVEGFQAVYQRQAEIMKELVDEANVALNDAKNLDASDAQVSDRIDHAKDALETTTGHMREISELISKSQAEAFDILNNRASESLEELKSALAGLKEQKPSKKQK